jgi:hypothetical protein
MCACIWLLVTINTNLVRHVSGKTFIRSKPAYYKTKEFKKKPTGWIHVKQKRRIGLMEFLIAVGGILIQWSVYEHCALDTGNRLLIAVQVLLSFASLYLENLSLLNKSTIDDTYIYYTCNICVTVDKCIQ